MSRNPFSSMNRWAKAVCIVGFYFSWACAWAADPGPESAHSAAPGGTTATNRVGAMRVVSISHRFIVEGPIGVENANLAEAAEIAAGKVESLLNEPLPFARGQYIRLTMRRPAHVLQGHVFKYQDWGDFDLMQELVIVNPEKVDQEDILEELCWLLLNRYVIGRQPVEQRKYRLGTVPEWLSTGVAQNLYTSFRARNRQVVLKREEAGQVMPFSGIVDFERLPQGRWVEKAYCGMAFNWIRNSLRAREIIDGILLRRARGERISAEWLGQQMVEGDGSRTLESAWETWIAQQAQVQQTWGERQQAKVAELQELLVAQPAQLGVSVPEEVPEALGLAELIEYRKAKWMSALAYNLRLKIKSVSLGAAPEFRAVTELYGDYCNMLVRRERRGLSKWFGSGVPSRKKLQMALEKAEQGFADYKENLKKRDQRLLKMDPDSRIPGASSFSTNVIFDMYRSIPRSDLQRYVDEIERRQGK